MNLTANIVRVCSLALVVNMKWDRYVQKERIVAGCKLFPPQYSGASEGQCKRMLNMKTEIQIQNL
jgi:hypothetical protein